MNKRLKPKERRAQILDTALKLASETHYLKVTQSQIADELSISASLVLSYFGTMDNLRYNIITLASETENRQILAQVASVGKKLIRQRVCK